MCKMDVETPKWYLQRPELSDQGNCHAGSIQFQYPISGEHQYPNPQKLQGDSGQMYLDALILLLFQQHKTEIAGKIKSGNNSY